MARLPECWVQISVKFSHYTQLMHRAVWVAVWPCLLVLWAPPQSPLQEIFPISDSLPAVFSRDLQPCPLGMRVGGSHVTWIYPPLHPVLLVAVDHFLCLSTVFLPKNKTLMLTTVSITAPRWEASFWLGSSFREKRGPHLDVPRA